MPKMKIDEDAEIVAFSPQEVERLDTYFSGTNAETAYLLGRYCGLRINECYGLKWSNVDTEHGTITIDRQMQYQEGLIKLVSLKTRNARRTVYMSQKLRDYFVQLQQERALQSTSMAAQRLQNQTWIKDIDGALVSSLDLVNSLPSGKIQTVNSMKYHSRTVKSELGIPFKFHYLRHTYGTRLAEMNTPMHILCNQMGHASGKVTERYYRKWSCSAKLERPSASARRKVRLLPQQSIFKACTPMPPASPHETCAGCGISTAIMRAVLI